MLSINRYQVLEAIDAFRQNPTEENKELLLKIMEEDKAFAFTINTVLGSYSEDLGFARRVREKYLSLCKKR